MIKFERICAVQIKIIYKTHSIQRTRTFYIWICDGKTQITRLKFKFHVAEGNETLNLNPSLLMVNFLTIKNTKPYNATLFFVKAQFIGT